MKNYRIKIYPAAEKDLQDIIAYLSTFSYDAALRYYDKIIAEISYLSEMPFRCPVPRDFSLAARGYRYLIVKDYLVFYVVEDSVVQIRRVLYGRRDYTKLL